MLNSKYIKAAIIVILILITGIGITFSVFSGLSYYNNQTTKTSNKSSQNSLNSSSLEQTQIISSTSSQKQDLPETVVIKTLTMGDVFWGRYINDWSLKSPLKEAYPFSGLATFEKEKYDAWIADMECPVTEAEIDSATQERFLSFNCNTRYLPEAAKWFDIMTLANNHTDNMENYLGKPFDGFNKTRTNLGNSGIQVFGHHDSQNKNDICEVVSIFSKQAKVWVPIATCGFNNIFKLPTEDQIAKISEYAKYLPTFVYPQQGKEYQIVADNLQRQYAKKYIDAGADAVIGDHVHVVQDTEVYKGKLIIYSLGNFIFDQQRGNTTQALVLDSTITFTNDENFTKFIEMGFSCKKFKDSCLEMMKAQDLKKPTFSINYEAIGSDNSNKLAKKANPAITEIILKQAKWANTKNLLKK